MLREVLFNMLRTVRFLAYTIISSILAGWWIADLSGSPITWTKMNEYWSTYIVTVYIILISLAFFYEGKKETRERREQFVDGIWETALAQANRSIEEGDFKTVEEIRTMLDASMKK